MKTIKFKKELSEKTSTWRLFDDKNLSTNDECIFVVSETQTEFAKAILTFVKETTLGNLQDEDYDGHEKYNSNKELFASFRKYYDQEINKDTKVKVIRFELQ